MDKNGIVFFIDQEQFKTSEKVLTAMVLLQDFAKEDPAQTTLVHKHGNELNKYEDDNEIIHLKNGMKFIIYHDTPTGVS
jgi:hypothetical protein